MAPYRGSSGAVAIGLPGTAVSSYATAITGTHLLHVDAFGEANGSDLFDRRDIASGYEEGLGVSVTQGNKRVTISGPLCDISFSALMALALGTDTKTTIDTSGRQHEILPSASTAELPQTSLYFKHGGIADTGSTGSVAFHGCVLDTLSLSGQAGGIWRYSATFCTSGVGTNITTDISGYTKPNYLPFRFGFTKYSVSTTTPSAVTYDKGTASTSISGGTGWTLVDLSTYLRGQTITINNNCNVIYTGASTTGEATLVTRTNRVCTVTTNLLFDAVNTLRTYITAMTGTTTAATGLITRCVGATLCSASLYNYGWEVLIPKTNLTSVDMAKTLGTREVTTTHTVVDAGSAGIYTIYGAGWNANDVQYTP